MSTQEVIRCYRHLYRHGLRAVQFSKPARFVFRNRLRRAFQRPSPNTEFNLQKVQNTIEFLKYATTHNGLEHKILKNLLVAWRNQEFGGKSQAPKKAPTPEELRIKTTAYDAFNHNIEMLNESMDMCIPAVTVRDPNF
ncbi:DUF1763-domain-containing protein [Periconia macrospinosa]|uniref:DUF1763-domain-containing protein n=1 Tax=Periconia macrospinosa TaxID=97972 RepID=A0A2V1DCA4_9PLEO|nr:DUF1763-domain-containing protein [Periconia macrospinosa]